jgi:hypothetical protein
MGARAPRLTRAKLGARARTLSVKHNTLTSLAHGRELYPEVALGRPQTRLDCTRGVDGERPCPWVSCKHHLYLDVNHETGSIKFNFPDLEVDELAETCALDAADRGGLTLEEVGAIMNLTRERIRQVEVIGLLKLKMASPSPEELGAGLEIEDLDE